MPWAPAATEPAFYDAATVAFPVFQDWKYFWPTSSVWPNVKINFLESVTTYYLKLYAQEAAQEITWAKRREEGRKETRKERNRAERHKEQGGRRKIVDNCWQESSPLKDPLRNCWRECKLCTHYGNQYSYSWKKN